MINRVWFLLLLSGSVCFAADPGLVVSNTASMSVGRISHAIVHLTNDMVVCFGGHDPSFTALNSAAVYNPVGNSFTYLTMNSPRDTAAFARLADGTYLLAGGYTSSGLSGYITAEVFDPAAMTFTAVGNLSRFRAGGQAATLASGRVLIAGGWWTWNDAPTVADLYDPQAKTFAAVGSLNTPRTHPVVLPCDDGGAVVVGGYTPAGGSLGDAKPEYFNPSTKLFSPISSSLATGETNWIVSWQPSVVDDFKLPDGRYVAFASRTATGGTEYALFLFSPSDKTFARVPMNPAFPISSRYGRSNLTLDAANSTAYVIGIDAQISPYGFQLSSIHLLTGATRNTTFASLPRTYTTFGPGPGAATFHHGKVFVTGGTTSNNYGGVPWTEMLSFGSVPPSLQIALYAGLTITGDVGRSYRILTSDSVSGPNWQTLTNIVLPSSPYLFFDPQSATNRSRFYEVELVTP